MLSLSENIPLCKYKSRIKKPVLVSTTFSLVTETRKEEFVHLERVPYIYYSHRFWKNTKIIKTVVDSGIKINALIPACASILNPKVYHINVKAQKIDGSTLDNFGMILVSF